MDDQFQNLTTFFNRVGKVGKPLKAPEVKFNNKLLLQLHALREESGTKWEDIESFFARIIPDAADLPPLMPLIRSAVRQFQKVKEDEVQNFLAHDREVYYIGPFSKQVNVTRQSLVKNSLPETSISVSNGLVAELSNFAAKQGFKDSIVADWLNKLSGKCLFSSSEQSSLKTCVNKVKGEISKLRKSQNKPGGAAVMKSFLEAPFSTTKKAKSSSAIQPPSDSELQTSSTFTSLDTEASTSSHVHDVVSEITRENAHLTKELRRKECEVKHLNDQLQQIILWTVHVCNFQLCSFWFMSGKCHSLFFHNICQMIPAACNLANNKETANPPEISLVCTFVPK